MTEPEKKKFESVVDKNEVVVKKKSKGTSMLESFLGEEVDSVKDHIVYDMIIPSTKDAMNNMFGGIIDFFNDMFHDFIDSILFGDSGNPRTKPSETYVSYQGYYKSKSSRSSSKYRDRREQEQKSRRHSLDDIEFNTIDAALKVRKELIDLSASYPYITVADLFDLSEQTLDWVEYQEKDKIGWRSDDLRELGRPKRRRGKYILPLPRPERLED